MNTPHPPASIYSRRSPRSRDISYSLLLSVFLPHSGQPATLLRPSLRGSISLQPERKAAACLFWGISATQSTGHVQGTSFELKRSYYHSFHYCRTGDYLRKWDSQLGSWIPGWGATPWVQLRSFNSPLQGKHWLFLCICTATRFLGPRSWLGSPNIFLIQIETDKSSML